MAFINLPSGFSSRGESLGGGGPDGFDAQAKLPDIEPSGTEITSGRIGGGSRQSAAQICAAACKARTSPASSQTRQT